MIFVTLGSQKFQFDRLLKEIDKLVEENVIKEEVFAQVGYSTYIPKNYAYKDFLNREDFSEIMGKCDKVITHGGTGAIVGALKKGKKVIAASRLVGFGEHVDDHQTQIIRQFTEMNLISGCENTEELAVKYQELNSRDFKVYESNTQAISNSIDEFICKEII